MTTGLLGVDDQGSPTGTVTAPLITGPGYEDEWFDLKSKQLTSTSA